VLATGNHFVLDIAGGVLALALAVWLVGSPDRLAGRLLSSPGKLLRRGRPARAPVA
jgi:membrane-associated phospholipid phosphatase